MAISHRATGTWTELTADGTVGIPAGATTGDRMYLLAAWKDFAITATVANWTEVTEFADGAVSAGNGTGSIKVGCWYKDHAGTEEDPALDFSSSPTVSGAVIIALQKGGGETWDDPLSVTAALSWTTSATTTAASSTVTVKNGAAVLNVIGIRDDSATFTRGTSGVDAASGVTWNGDYVESPATHHSTTTGFDGSYDAGYRLVTTGGAGISLRATGTISAAETGSSLWIVQGVHSDTTVTPTTASLALTTFAPTVTATADVLAVPPTLALTLTTFAPTVTTPSTYSGTPATATLTLTTFAPSVSVLPALNPGSYDPELVSLSWYDPHLSLSAAWYEYGPFDNAFVETVEADNNVTVTPTTAAITLTTFAPSVLTPRLVTPGTQTLTLTTFAPSVLAPRLITPTTRALTLTTFAPVVSAPRMVTPGTLALTLTAFAPSVAVPRLVTPGTAALVLTAFAPIVSVSGGEPSGLGWVIGPGILIGR
jgi:hypothetical protein